MFIRHTMDMQSHLKITKKRIWVSEIIFVILKTTDKTGSKRQFIGCILYKERNLVA